MINLNRLLRYISLSVALLSAGYVSAADITGAGATFPYPVYSKWANAYKTETGTGVNYQPIGSSNGLKQIQSRTVDFAATDAPLKENELESAGLVQFPVIIGGVVPVVNVNGVEPGKLKLNGTILADIFLGKITKWNDWRIAADNPGVALPDEAITVIHRSDGSGTTFIFTSYLAQVSPEWKKSVGVGKEVYWPTGTGGKGNEGVTAYVQRIRNSIGYVEYAYALQNKLTFTQMRNRDGHFVMPDYASFNAAANARSDTGKGFYEILPNESGKDSWPITGATFVLIYKSQEKPVNATRVLEFFDWAFTNGDKLASDLDYVPLPANLKMQIRNAWKTQIKDTSGNSLWK
ncbi:MAG: phosphate ABC transporter substrate-binding protein PstS [Gammaproteobacteria bacterium]|nr:phosphate ABC transporter substrate-binding protein PstS [Gammaproteobacteria bacterium]MBU1481719.1 phosphate ABC transporter substrate-binding protein PstS [Gammaproteobacteria bacterium]